MWLHNSTYKKIVITNYTSTVVSCPDSFWREGSGNTPYNAVSTQTVVCAPFRLKSSVTSHQSLHDQIYAEVDEVLMLLREKITSKVLAEAKGGSSSSRFWERCICLTSYDNNFCYGCLFLQHRYNAERSFSGLSGKKSVLCIHSIAYHTILFLQ